MRGLIAERLGATLSLMLGGAVIWLAVGLPVGILSALRRGSRLDRASMGTALVFVSAPEYWLGLIALYLFAADIGQVKIFPGAGSYVGLTSDPWKWFTSLILPWLVLAAGSAAIYARLMRGSLSETMQEDYIRTARAKGLGERRVVLRHGVRVGDQPDPDDPRARHRDAARRRDPRRSRLQHPRDRAARLHRDQARGPARRAGHRVAGGAVHHRREHRRGHCLCIPGPTCQVLMIIDTGFFSGHPESIPESIPSRIRIYARVNPVNPRVDARSDPMSRRHRFKESGRS